MQIIIQGLVLNNALWLRMELLLILYLEYVCLFALANNLQIHLLNNVSKNAPRLQVFLEKFKQRLVLRNVMPVSIFGHKISLDFVFQFALLVLMLIIQHKNVFHFAINHKTILEMTQLIDVY